MSWIKRNLIFVIVSAVALLAMGGAGWFLYTKWDLNNQILEKLNQDVAELSRLNQEKPHPGSGQVDNIKLAREQEQELRAFIKHARDHFERIPSIPDLAKPTEHDFYVALSRTIDQMQRDATNASVALTPNYTFSFEAQKQRVSFAAGSLVPLSAQLGEVKAICDIIFQAKVNSLDNIRRERVSDDDRTAAGQNDYLQDTSATNDLAVLTPYEITFHSFSSELAQVLAGFANSRYPVLVRGIKVESAAPTGVAETQPATAPAAVALDQTYGARMRYAFERGMMMPGMAPQVAAPVAAPPPRSTGLKTVLEEKPLKITLELVVVKLRPALK
jgi:hypothetical protein